MKARIFMMASVITLLACLPLAAQDWPRIVVGNLDHSPIDVPAQGDVTLTLWVDLPGWVNRGLISFFGNHFITQWIGVEILYPWAHDTLTNGNMISLSFWPAPPRPDSLFRLADFTLHIDADSSYWGYPINVIFGGPTMFVDSLGIMVDDITPLISPLCIECQTSAMDPAMLPDEIAHAIYPNPFNSSVAISLFLPRPGKLNMTIYDVAGHRVRTLHDGTAYGDVRAIWDGTDAGGNHLSSGVYFCRVEYDGHAYSSKLILLR